MRSEAQDPSLKDQEPNNGAEQGNKKGSNDKITRVLTLCVMVKYHFFSTLGSKDPTLRSKTLPHVKFPITKDRATSPSSPSMRPANLIRHCRERKKGGRKVDWEGARRKLGSEMIGNSVVNNGMRAVIGHKDTAAKRLIGDN